ncbi:MAG: NAD(P)/FAD-dependent oxidoreductase [Lapillicoccus sp.]
MQATRPESADAVVIGGGPNGLVAAITLADAGWDVVLVEARDKVGGAVSSVRRDGWVMDEFSACYPLAVASPVMGRLGLEDHGLRWSRTPVVVSHPGGPDDPHGATIHADPTATAAGLEAEHSGDGQAWLDLVAEYDRIKEPFLDALLTRWPPVEAATRLARRVGASDLPALARFFLLPVTRMGEERFGGQRGRLLLAGNAMHADIPPDAPGSGLFGWFLAMLAQDVGFPSPQGGAGMLAEALASRARAAGVEIRTGMRVEGIDVVSGRASVVRVDGGPAVRARRAVVADTSAASLYDSLLSPDVVPSALQDRMREFAWDLPTVKLNYRLRATPPWTATEARSAGVVHAGGDMDDIVRWSADLATRTVPQRPFALVGQMSTIDPTRSPEGTEALWLYTHLPRGVTDDDSADRLVETSEGMLDAYAPGWRELVVDRWVQRPSDLAAADANLVGGAVNGGTAQLFQQLIFRPVTGLGGPRTPVEGLYLGSAAIHPGGGVHGSCGHLAARTALADARWWARPATAALRSAQRRIEA